MFMTCPFSNITQQTLSCIMLPFGITSHYLIYDKLQSRAEERPYSLFHTHPFLQLFPYHVGSLSQFIGAGCDVFYSTANRMSGFMQGKQRAWYEDDTCSQDNGFWSLPEALSTVRDTK